MPRPRTAQFHPKADEPRSYAVDWRSTGQLIYSTPQPVADLMGWTVATLLQNMSTHRGVIKRALRNPITEELDHVTVKDLGRPVSKEPYTRTYTPRELPDFQRFILETLDDEGNKTIQNTYTGLHIAAWEVNMTPGSLRVQLVKNDNSITRWHRSKLFRVRVSRILPPAITETIYPKQRGRPAQPRLQEHEITQESLRTKTPKRP